MECDLCIRKKNRTCTNERVQGAPTSIRGPYIAAPYVRVYPPPPHLAPQTGIADLLPAIRVATRVHPEDADVVKSTLMLLRMLACGETLKVRSAV